VVRRRLFFHELWAQGAADTGLSLSLAIHAFPELGVSRSVLLDE